MFTGSLWSNISFMDVLLLLVRLFLAAVFAVAGTAKFLDLEGTEKAARDFGVPEDISQTFAVALPTLEIMLALLLLPVFTAWIGAIGIFLLLLIFIGAMLWQMAKGRTPDCHCFGKLASEPVGSGALIRNLIFAGLAFVLVASGSGNQGLSVLDFPGEPDFMQIILGLTTIGLLAAGIVYLRKISDQQQQIMRRIELLELIAQESGEVAREDVFSPHAGLPIGAPAPDFELPDLKGRVVSLEHLLHGGKPVLLVFVSPTCSPCQALEPELAAWQQELKDRLDFVFISRGSAGDNEKNLGGEPGRQILLQKEKEVQELYLAPWTPTALLVGAAGKIAGHPAAGDTAIRALVEKIKSANVADELFFAANGHSPPPQIGESITDFKLPELSGKLIAKQDLLGRKTLAMFWSLTCPHCSNMLDELRNWEKTNGTGGIQLVLFSRGETEAHQALNLSSPVLLDENYETSEKLGMKGTPSAVLINEEGVIVSETAIGAAQIRALIGKRK